MRSQGLGHRRARNIPTAPKENTSSLDIPDPQICVVLLEEGRVSYNLPDVMDHLLSGNFLFSIQYFRPVSKV